MLYDSTVSVLFSEPKIPQPARGLQALSCADVSVLFSEPKIPQPGNGRVRLCDSNPFQCSSASRKFLNSTPAIRKAPHPHAVSVLFSEPKIPQLFFRCERQTDPGSFSALQRAENSSNAQPRAT